MRCEGAGRQGQGDLECRQCPGFRAWPVVGKICQMFSKLVSISFLCAIMIMFSRSSDSKMPVFNKGKLMRYVFKGVLGLVHQMCSQALPTSGNKTIEKYSDYPVIRKFCDKKEQPVL